MKKSNPVFIARNHQVQEAIELVESGDYKYFKFLVQAYKHPFDDVEEYAKLKLCPTNSQVVSETFCGT